MTAGPYKSGRLRYEDERRNDDYLGHRRFRESFDRHDKAVSAAQLRLGTEL